MRIGGRECEIITPPVVMMISLDHSPGTVSLAPLHDITGLIIDLKGPLLAVLVVQWPDCNVLQGNDSFRCSLGRVLEIVQAAVRENKPTSLPALPTSALKWSTLLIAVIK